MTRFIFGFCIAVCSFCPVGLAADTDLYSAWSFRLPDGNPAWLKVSPPAGDGETPSVDLLWSVGSAKPASGVSVNGGRLVFERRVNWKPGGGKITKRIEGPFTAQLVDANQLRLRFQQRSVSDSATDQTTDLESVELVGRRIPPPPAKPDLETIRFGKPIPLFNGRDLDGWKLSRVDKTNGWRAERGVLVNETPKKDFGAYGSYGNLITTDVFDDFRLTIEYNVPKGGNSGIYLRGMYEAQVVDRDSRMQGIQGPGAIFGRIKPTKNAANEGGQWNRYVLTLIDRHITVELNGEVVIDNELLVGCTGGGLQSDDTRPGPIFLQGDHTSIRYRNIVLEPVIRR